MKRFSSCVVLLGLGVVASACSDAVPPTEPIVPDRPLLQITTASDLAGLFFFGPPVGAGEDPAADFDPTQLPVAVFEICLRDDLDGEKDPLGDVCTHPLGRWTADGGPGGAQIVLVQGGEDEWYQVDVPFGDFERADLVLGQDYVGRVILGDAAREVGTDFEVYGAFEFVLVENQRGRNPNADPMQVVWNQTLPVKWFLGEGAAVELLCEAERCTVAVITAEHGGELCFPVADCSSSEATAGVSIQEDVLPHDIVLKIEDIDLGTEPNPLGIPNPQIEEAVDISATPAFDDLPAFDNNGDGVADIAVQLCYFTEDPDNYATYRGTDGGPERLPFDPRGDFIFPNSNCDENGQNENGQIGFLGEGLLGKLHLAMRASATTMARPLARWLGPEPLRAGDISFTADTRGFSPFVPALVLDLAANEVPAPLVAGGETVTISVCVEGAHPGIQTPTQEPGIDVTFETEDGTFSAGNGQGSSVVVAAAPEEPTADCVNQANPGGQVAVARASWTLPAADGEYSARAFVSDDYLVSEEVNGVYELVPDVIEVVFETEAQNAIIVAAIAPGDRHTCAVDGSDAALCWGQNNFGQLGDGNEPTNSDRPVFVSSQLAFTDISVWGDVSDGTNDLAHSCAVSAGDIWCWGYNGSGQLGDGTTDDSETPVLVEKPAAVEDFVTVSAGFGFTCAVDDGSRVWCWGRNTSGQLGIDDTEVNQSLVPVQVVSQTFFDSVVAGSGHACAVTNASDLWCWGANGSGQVGDGTTTARFAPVHIDEGIANVSAGEVHTCAVTTTGDALCWGANSFDQLGDGSTATQTSPVGVQNPLGLSFSEISAGGHHSCATAFTAEGRRVAACWGANFSGQLGDDSISPSGEPVLVVGGLEFARVEAGIAHTCGFSARGGAAYCWGLNDNGQVGNGDTGVSPRLPTPVLPPDLFIVN